MKSDLTLRSLGAAWSAIAVVAASLVLAGCAKRATQVEVGYTTPEGVPSDDARLVVWKATTTEMNVYEDELPPGPSFADVLIGTQTIAGDPVGSIQGMLFDHTPAGAFRMMRREPGGGLRAFEDFPSPPSRKWLANQWEIYRFSDESPSEFTPPSYLGRGLIDGQTTVRSPLTNEAIAGSDPLGNINIVVTEDPVAGVDTISVIRWDLVPGAAHYLIHIYEFRGASVSQQIVSGLPSPVYDAQSRDHFVLWFRWGAGSVPQYRLGDTRPDLDILYQRPLLPQPLPVVGSALVRVSAFDATGRMIAYSRNPAGNPPGNPEDPFPRNYGVAPVSDTQYGIFPLGALQVERIRFPRPR